MFIRSRKPASAPDAEWFIIGEKKKVITMGWEILEYVGGYSREGIRASHRFWTDIYPHDCVILNVTSMTIYREVKEDDQDLRDIQPHQDAAEAR